MYFIVSDNIVTKTTKRYAIGVFVSQRRIIRPSFDVVNMYSLATSRAPRHLARVPVSFSNSLFPLFIEGVAKISFRHIRPLEF